MARRRAELTVPQGPIEVDFGTVELRPDADGVLLLIDGVESSHLDDTDPTQLMFEYMQQMQAVLRSRYPGRGRLVAVHLGAAGCALARAIDAQWPDSRQLAVEIDAKLAAGVRQWFDLPRSPRLRIRVGEAREQLATLAPGAGDVIVRDAFQGRSVPAHLRTLEFTREVAERLRPDGVYLANLADRGPLLQARREAATIHAVFDHCVVIAEPAVLKGRRYGNVVVAASHEPVRRPGLERALRTLPVPASVIDEAAVAGFVAGVEPFLDPPQD